MSQSGITADLKAVGRVTERWYPNGQCAVNGCTLTYCWFGFKCASTQWGRDWRGKTLCLTCCWDVLAKCSKLVCLRGEGHSATAQHLLRTNVLLAISICNVTSAKEAAMCDTQGACLVRRPARHLWLCFVLCLRSPRWRQISAAPEGASVIWWWIGASSESNVSYRSPGAVMGCVY